MVHPTPSRKELDRNRENTDFRGVHNPNDRSAAAGGLGVWASTHATLSSERSFRFPKGIGNAVEGPAVSLANKSDLAGLSLKCSQPLHRQVGRESIGQPLVGGDEFCLRAQRQRYVDRVIDCSPMGYSQPQGVRYKIEGRNGGYLEIADRPKIPSRHFRN